MTIKHITLLLFFFGITITSFAQNLDYPKKTVNGKEFYIYHVASGEGFFAIGRKFNTTQEEILKYNPEAQYGLKGNQELLIPVHAQKAPTESENIFIHTVQPGETLYAIANMYHVTTQKLIELNPGSDKGIKIGFELKIPQSDSNNPSNSDDKYIYHTIAPKETLFSVQQKYNSTIESIMIENPGLTPGTFTIGKVIRVIPNLKPEEPVEAEEIIQEELKPEPTYIQYKVKRKETLFSISQKFNVSIQSILDSNPGLTKLSRNDIINIPTQETAALLEKEEEQPETEIKPTIDSTRLINDIYNKINEVERKNEITVALMLPFMLNQPESVESSLYVEYYEGFLLAVDSLKKQGVSINLYVYDTEKSKNTVKTILNKPEAKNFDLIIGPVEDDLIKIVADFALENNINMVNVFSLKNDEVTHNARIFQTNIPHPYLYAETTQEFCNRFKNRKVVFIKDPNAKEKEDFISTLKTDLNRQSLPYIEHTLEELLANDAAILTGINQPILLVPTSESVSALSRIVPELRKVKEEHPDLILSLFGYPEWQKSVPTFIESFYILDTYFYTRFYIDPTDRQTDVFYQKFKYWYSKELINASPKFGILGFDTGMYFLNALWKYGRNFENQLDQINAKSIQTDFYFQRVNNWSGFINKGIYFVNFRPDYTIDKIKLR